MSKVKSGSEKGGLSGKRWASSVTISDNSSRQGVELHFDNDPHPELQSKLRTAGFLPSKSPAMWYAKASDNTRKFAENTHTVLAVKATGPDMFIQPSYQAGKANIENKRFSFVQISLKDGQEKSFIVFEPSKPRAEVIAANFAYKNYGKDYVALAVSPKSKMREARMLFDEGRIIVETEHEEESGFEIPAMEVKQPEQKQDQQKQTETLHVTIGGEKANLSLILHEFHNWLKDHPEHKGSTKIAKPVYSQWLHEHHPEVNASEAEKLWDRHQRLVKILHRIGNLDTKQIVVEPYSSIYKKLLRIIPDLAEHLQSGKQFAGKAIVGGYMDLHVDLLYKDKQGYNIALAHYYEQNGDLVPDPDMRIRVMPDTQMAEAMSFQDYRSYDEVYSEDNDRDLVNLDLKKKLNSFLNQWLSNLVSSGHKVVITAEEDNEPEQPAEPEQAPAEPAKQSPQENHSETVSEPEHIHIGKMEPIPGIKVDVDHLTPGEIKPISFPAYDAIGMVLKYAQTRAFKYDGKVWTTTATKSGDPIMHELTEFRNKPITTEVSSAFPAIKLPGNDPLATATGFYNVKTAGDRLEQIDIPMPAETYKITLQIVKTSFDNYRAGYVMDKEFGQRYARHIQPFDKGLEFATRAEAIEETLAEIIAECNDDAVPGRYFDKNEDLKAKNEITLEAIYKFAEERGYSRKELEFKAKAPLFNVELAMVVPVPDLKAAGSKTGMSHRISQYAHDQILHSLNAQNCEVWYYDAKAWQLNNGTIQPLTDLDSKVVKYYKNVYQKTAAFKELSKIRERETNVPKRAFDLLKKFIPGLESLLSQKVQGTLTFDENGEERSITCFFSDSHSQLLISEFIDDEKHMDSDIHIDLENEEARVTAEWLSDYYADRYDRLDAEGKLEGDDMAIGEDMTRGLTEWLEELIEDDRKVNIKGAAEKVQAQPDVFRSAYDTLKTVIPDLDLYLKGKRKKVALEYELGEEKKKLNCEFVPGKSTIVLQESIAGKKQMDSSVRVNVGTKEARVTKEWLSDYYAEGLGRHEVDPESSGNEQLAEKDMTRALVQWLGDLLETKLIITINPVNNKREDPLAFLNEPLVDEGATGKLRFSPVAAAKVISEDQEFIDEWRVAYTEDPKTTMSKLTREEVRRLKDFYNTFILGHAEKEEAYRTASDTLADDYFEIQETVQENGATAQFERSYPPAEEKRIQQGFKEMGFKTPFGVKEAFDRKFSVTDVGLRYQSTEQHYKKEIAAPLRKKEKALIADQKEHKYKAGTKKETAIRSELSEIAVRLLRGEEYYKRENEIFKDDFFEAVLKIVGKKGFTFSNQADLESFVEFVESSVFDETTFENYHRQPIDELVEQLMVEYFYEQVKNIKVPQSKGGAVAIDILLQGKAVPNVLVPAATKEPFWSNQFNIYDMEKIIKNNFPHLRKLTGATLFKATPIDMYELVQMSHPDEYGLKVSRSSVLREWEKRGKELFEGIGFPIDPDYPYVNIHTGYTSVETLYQQLNEYNKEGNHWWGVAEHNRPIADPLKALDYINREIDKLKKGIKACVNPKTNKPTAAKKEEYRDLSFDLRSVESGKLVIENYLKKSKTLPAKTKAHSKVVTTASRDLSILSDTFWKPEDEKHPANKAVIFGQEFDLSRLRHQLGQLLGKLPLTQQHLAIKELAGTFPLSTTLENYAKSLVTIGNSGIKREKLILAGYMDQIIMHYDIPMKGKSDYKVCHYLLDKFLNAETPQQATEPESADEEYVEVPFPNTTQINGKVILVAKANGTFIVGTQYSKAFGSQSFRRSNPGDNGKNYSNRKAAIIDGLLELHERLRYEMQHKDSIYNSEAKKNMKVKKALDALEVFAKEQTSLSQEQTGESVNSVEAQSELKQAFWLPADEEYPVDKAQIDGFTYHQARLREALIALIGKLPMEERLALAEELSGRFHERRPMQEYFNEKVNGTGNHGKKGFTGAYFDDLILDNDLKENSGWPVCKYLISVLLGKHQELVDKPQAEKPALRKIAKSDQHKINKEIEALIDKKDAKGASFSAEEKELIQQYAGSGGLLKQGAKGRGVLYEYYTPDWLVQQMWALARRFGYDGGSVLEPSVGIGNFLKYAPKEAIIFGFETNHYSARIAQVLYPHAHIHEKAFESLFFAGNIHLKDKIDHPLNSLVIGNPPYGEFTGKYAGMGEKKWTGALEYDQYFMLRGLDLLQPGGLLVFLVPSLFIQSGQKYNKTKDKILEKAEVLMCYRLPQNLFATTDIGTDIIVLRRRGGKVASETHLEGIDEESLPMKKAKTPIQCSITRLIIEPGDDEFYDLDKGLFIKALKIKGGDNPREIALNNPWLPDTIKQLFEMYMARHGDRNDLREKYYSEEAIYDPSLVIEAGLDYIHEAMFDAKVSSCWLHKIDITEAFGD